jgi:hypothetical protein
MGKIESRSIICPALKRAYEIAQRNAFENSSGIPSGVSWNAGKYGNSVTSKGTLTGSADCENCGKHITVTYNLKKIEASDEETRKPVKLYDTIGGTESISVSGHKCSEVEKQK